MNNNIFRRYARRRRKGHNQPVALLIAEQTSETSFRLGYSICHSQDQFNRKTAYEIAYERMVSSPFNVDLRDRSQIDMVIGLLPHSLSRVADNFLTYQRGKMHVSL